MKTFFALMLITTSAFANELESSRRERLEIANHFNGTQYEADIDNYDGIDPLYKKFCPEKVFVRKAKVGRVLGDYVTVNGAYWPSKNFNYDSNNLPTIKAFSESAEMVELDTTSAPGECLVVTSRNYLTFSGDIVIPASKLITTKKSCWSGSGLNGYTTNDVERGQVVKTLNMRCPFSYKKIK